MPDPLCKRKQGSPALRRFRVEQPQARPTAFHESRDTKHESRLLCFSSHDFPAFPAILRVPPPPGAGVRAPAAVPAGVTASAVRWKSRKSAQNPVCSGQNGKPRSPGSRRLRAASATAKAEGTHAEKGERCILHRQETFSIAFTFSLHFSPRGEAKCVTGPPAPETRLVRFFMRHETRKTAFDQARGASQRKFRGFHETRITAFMLFTNHGL